MAKPILKWRKVGLVKRAGPFTIELHGRCYLKCDGGYCNGSFPFASEYFAMNYAQNLARKIIAATKGKRHGK